MSDAPFQTRYGAVIRPVYDSDLPSATMQQFKTEADINYLIDRYKATGSFYDPLRLGNAKRGMPSFDDISAIPDVTEAMNTIVEATDIFGALPAKVRAQFGNDVAAFVAFAQNPQNVKACVELGIYEAIPSPEAESTALAVEETANVAPAKE